MRIFNKLFSSTISVVVIVATVIMTSLALFELQHLFAFNVPPATDTLLMAMAVGWIIVLLSGNDMGDGIIVASGLALLFLMAPDAYFGYMFVLGSAIALVARRWIAYDLRRTLKIEQQRRNRVREFQQSDDFSSAAGASVPPRKRAPKGTRSAGHRLGVLEGNLIMEPRHYATPQILDRDYFYCEDMDSPNSQS